MTAYSISPKMTTTTSKEKNKKEYEDQKYDNNKITKNIEMDSIVHDYPYFSFHK